MCFRHHSCNIPGRAERGKEQCSSPSCAADELCETHRSCHRGWTRAKRTHGGPPCAQRPGLSSRRDGLPLREKRKGKGNWWIKRYLLLVLYCARVCPSVHATDPVNAQARSASCICSALAQAMRTLRHLLAALARPFWEMEPPGDPTIRLVVPHLTISDCPSPTGRRHSIAQTFSRCLCGTTRRPTCLACPHVMRTKTTEPARVYRALSVSTKA